MKKLPLLSASLLLSLGFIACSNPKENEADLEMSTTQSIENPNLLIGSWLEPNPINEKEKQGIKLYQDGSAESVNMSTLRYMRWWKKDDSLILVAESIGNRISSIDTIRFQIFKLDSQNLELQGNGMSTSYERSQD